MATSNANRKVASRMLRNVRYFTLALMIMLLCQAVGNQSAAEASSASQRRDHKAVMLEHVELTPAQGPSWLEHLGRHMNESSMGETGLLGPNPMQEEGAAPLEVALPPGGSLSLNGAELYKLSCRGCHGERGEGVPPEINSMIDPVRATSTGLILARMKKVGAPVSETVARQLASQAQTSLLQRIHHGGQNMPPFPHLTPEEVQALVAYLDLLVGIPNSEDKQITIEMPVAHVGEDLVKGTCHICHSATGPNPTPEEILQGAIPPLAVLLKRVGPRQFVQKVTVGRPIIMGNLDQQYRGRMPVFYYLTPDEAAAAYVYLERYPAGGKAHLQNHAPRSRAEEGRLEYPYHSPPWNPPIR